MYLIGRAHWLVYMTWKPTEDEPVGSFTRTTDYRLKSIRHTL